MEETGERSFRGELRRLLRVARAEAWAVDELERTLMDLFGRGVDDQPAPTPDQIPRPTLA